VVTLVNALKLCEFIFLLYVSSNSKVFRRKLRRMCCRVPARKASGLNANGDPDIMQDPDADGDGEKS